MWAFTLTTSEYTLISCTLRCTELGRESDAAEVDKHLFWYVQSKGGRLGNPTYGSDVIQLLRNSQGDEREQLGTRSQIPAAPASGANISWPTTDGCPVQWESSHSAVLSSNCFLRKWQWKRANFGGLLLGTSELMHTPWSSWEQMHDRELLPGQQTMSILASHPWLHGFSDPHLSSGALQSSP